MPESRTPLVMLRGSAAYGKYLDRLLAEARRRGLTVESRTGITELALNKLGIEWGMRPPQRARPIGANQHPLDATGEDQPDET